MGGNKRLRSRSLPSRRKHVCLTGHNTESQRYSGTREKH